MKRLRWVTAYVATSGLGLGLAYLLSLSLLAPAHSQAPSDGSLPPEFMNEVNQPAGQSPAPPPPPSQTTPPGPQQPPPSSVPAQQGSPLPPPPPSADMVPVSPGAAAMSGTAVGPEDYVYDPTGRRDPFKPYRAVRTDDKSKKVVEVVLEPLQRYDVEQLSVMGILWDVRQPRALVKDSDGRFHTVVKNTKIGRYNGYVAAIREGEIIVIETYDEEGKTLKRTKVMEFKKRDHGGAP